MPFGRTSAALPATYPALAQLGWSAELAGQLEPGLVPGRVAAAHRGAFDVWTAEAAVRSRLPGRLLHEGLDVAVGDWVGLSLAASPAKPAPPGARPRAAYGDPVGEALIRSVLPRTSAISRAAAGLTTTAQTLAANVDVAFVCTSLGPDLEPRRIERYLVTIWESGASPEVVLTKADRLDDPWPLVADVEAAAPGVPVHAVSALTGQGCDALRARIGPGASAVLLGSSGVGKSTLVNRWLGEEAMATHETREDDDEGRHTTTHRQLLVLPGGGLVIDTPGLRELQLWDVGAAALETAFADVEELAGGCRFRDCTHTREPGCAVLAAVESGALPWERLESWRKLQRELRSIAVRHDARLRKEEVRKWKLRAREAQARTRRR